MNQFIPRRQDVDFQLLRTVIAFQTANAVATLAVEGQMDFIALGFKDDICFLLRWFGCFARTGCAVDLIIVFPSD